MKKLLLCICLIICICASIYAQTEEESKKIKVAMGITPFSMIVSRYPIQMLFAVSPFAALGVNFKYFDGSNLFDKLGSRGIVFNIPIRLIYVLILIV